MDTPPRQVFLLLLINLSCAFRLFQREIPGENLVQLKLSKCRCVVLILQKSGTFEWLPFLLPSIQI